MIHVLRGTDVPVRTSYYKRYVEYLQNVGESSNDTQKAYQELYFLKQVESYIEVRFYDPETKVEQIQRTPIAEGQCPEWNTLLEFVFKAKNNQNFTKSELEQSKAMLYFTLFDQETVIE
jgi:hypothetical protein